MINVSYLTFSQHWTFLEPINWLITGKRWNNPAHTLSIPNQCSHVIPTLPILRRDSQPSIFSPMPPSAVVPHPCLHQPSSPALWPSISRCRAMGLPLALALTGICSPAVRRAMLDMSRLRWPMDTPNLSRSSPLRLTNATPSMSSLAIASA